MKDPHAHWTPEQHAEANDQNHIFHERMRFRQEQAEVLPKHDCPECGGFIDPTAPHYWNGKALIHHGCAE